MKSDKNTALMAAYKATRYRITEGSHFTLKVDTFSPHLQHLYQQQQVKTAAFITACNPRSTPLDEVENQLRMQRLAADVTALSLVALEGIGEDPSGKWAGEPSLLVLGISKEQAQRLGQTYEQHAMLWCGADAVPRLLWL